MYFIQIFFLLILFSFIRKYDITLNELSNYEQNFSKIKLALIYVQNEI